jgi:hypothetical protein
MIPLFGGSMADGKRFALEGRLISVAVQALRLGIIVVLDFGLSGRRTVGTALAGGVGRGSVPGDLPARR